MTWHGGSIQRRTWIVTAEKVEAMIGLYFTDQPPRRQPMLLQLENDGAIDIPPGSAAALVTDHLILPIDVDLLAIYPHAHYLGKQVRAWAELPDGRQTQLLRIDDWDINWQATYTYRVRVHLPAGTRGPAAKPTDTPPPVFARTHVIDRYGILPSPGAETEHPSKASALASSEAVKEKTMFNFNDKLLLFPAALIFSSSLFAPTANAQDPTCPYTQASIQGAWGVVGTYGANVAKAFGHRSVDASGVMTGNFVLNAPTTGSTTGARTVSTGTQAGTYIINCDGTGVINRTTTSSLGIIVTTVDNFAVTKAIVQDEQLIATELVDAQQIPSGLVPGGVFLTRVHTRLPAPSSNAESTKKNK